MRILIAHSNYRVAGGEDRYVEQELQLLKRRHDVHLYLKHNDDLKDGMRTAATMLYSRAERNNLVRVIKETGTEAIHLHNPYPSMGPAVHLAAKELSVPLVMTLHNFRLRCPNSYAFTEGERCTRCVRGAYHNAATHDCFPTRSQGVGYAVALWMHRFVLRYERYVRLFLCPSHFIATTMIGWGLPREKVKVIRNFTSIEAPSEGDGRGYYGSYVGRLSDEKGLDVLLQALKLAGDPEFVIAGDGPAAPQLRELSRSLGLQRLTFTGRVDTQRVGSILAGARFLALPSLWDENAPLAALEAMALGTPLVVTDRGGLPELADEGRGIIVPPRSPEPLASAIEAMLSGGDKWELASESGRRFVESYCRPRNHLKTLEEAFTSVI